MVAARDLRVRGKVVVRQGGAASEVAASSKVWYTVSMCSQYSMFFVDMGACVQSFVLIKISNQNQQNYICRCMYVYMYTHACTHMQKHAHVYVHVHVYVYAFAYVSAYECKHTNAHTHACVYMYIYTRIYIYIYIYTHTYLHTYIHTYIHTYTRILHVHIDNM